MKAQGEGSEQDARVGGRPRRGNGRRDARYPKMTKARNAKPTSHRCRCTTGDIGGKRSKKNAAVPSPYLRRTFVLNLPYLRFICILGPQDLQLAGISADLPYLCH